MPEDLRARLTALVAEWQHIRQQLQEAPLDSAAERYYTNAQAWTYGRCAGEVAALLREPPAVRVVATERELIAAQFGEREEPPEEFTPEQHAALSADYNRWLAQRDEPRKLLTAALLALRSYQYGNASTELAREVADPIDAYLKARAAAPEEP